MYFGARYYNPTIGRWLSPDPLGMVNGPNLYANCNNNPTNLIDPWGLETAGGGSGSGGKCPNADQTPTNPDEDSNPIDPQDILNNAWNKYGDGSFDPSQYEWRFRNLNPMQWWGGGINRTGLWIPIIKQIWIDPRALKMNDLIIASVMKHEMMHTFGHGDRQAYLAQNELIRSHCPGWNGWIGLDIYKPSDW